MPEGLKKWQRSLIRSNIEKYRQVNEDNFVKYKPFFINDRGEKVYSLIIPPFGSLAASRRLRFIARDLMDKNTAVDEQGRTRWGQRTPHAVTFAVTYECQCSCSHCSAYDYRRRVEGEGSALTMAELNSVIGDAIDIGTTCAILTGGEPLLLPDIDALIAGINPNKCICTLFTNGAGLDEDMVRRLKKAGVFGVYVSLDFSDRAAHDRNRNYPGLFDTAVRGIARLQAANIPVGISTFVSREKIGAGEVDRYMDLARELGVLEVFIFDQVPTGRLKDDHQCGMALADSQALKRIRDSFQQRPEYPRIIHQTMFTGTAYPCVGEGCPAAFVTMHVRANGDITPCDFTPVAFGNVRERSIGDIWREMTASPIYAEPAKNCRFQDDGFRRFLRNAQNSRP